MEGWLDLGGADQCTHDNTGKDAGGAGASVVPCVLITIYILHAQKPHDKLRVSISYQQPTQP